MRLRALAPAKVNLCLFLGPTRADGRHELVTLFQSTSLADELGLETLASGPDHVICPEVPEDNLAFRAIAALRERGWGGPPVRISIRKRIPVAGGMAGGSADAAAALRLAMAIAPGRPEEVDAVASSLGADVPSQLAPGLAVGTGAGELIEHFGPIAQHAFVIVPSPHALSTAAVFGEADRLGLPRSVTELRARREALYAALTPAARLPDELLVNDLAPAAVSLCPSVADGLSAVREAGADRALVCGSGPTVAGIFWGQNAPERAAVAAEELRSGHPGALAATSVTAEFAAPTVG